MYLVLCLLLLPLMMMLMLLMLLLMMVLVNADGNTDDDACDGQDELAELTAGYCGADMKALCAEATLLAVRRCGAYTIDSDRQCSFFFSFELAPFKAFLPFDHTVEGKNGYGTSYGI